MAIIFERTKPLIEPDILKMANVRIFYVKNFHKRKIASLNSREATREGSEEDGHQ